MYSYFYSLSSFSSSSTFALSERRLMLLSLLRCAFSASTRALPILINIFDSICWSLFSLFLICETSNCALCLSWCTSMSRLSSYDSCFSGTWNMLTLFFFLASSGLVLLRCDSLAFGWRTGRMSACLDVEGMLTLIRESSSAYWSVNCGSSNMFSFLSKFTFDRLFFDFFFDLTLGDFDLDSANFLFAILGNCPEFDCFIFYLPLSWL